ncbi:hypothetical protein ACLI09_02630 [Flavobacterium sp. RHBU_24]|uniref:hypothetical protein n=1 Tax=Flavobacterium sp. RHBU_24 TaxID=3391185 RepID=UPI0039847EA3
MLKIPFGKHKVTGKFYDAGMVPNGKNCNCVCNACGADLQAVHPKLLNRQQHFRHSANSNCTGALESLFHIMAKQILKESGSICIESGNSMSYTYCDIETPRHGKRPDAYLSNLESSLIVEVFFSHRIDDTTLDTYLENGEKVLEIDISTEKRRLYNYEHLKELVLIKATRKLFLHPRKEELKKQKSDGDITGWLVGALIILGLWFVSKLTRGRSRYRK